MWLGRPRGHDVIERWVNHHSVCSECEYSDMWPWSYKGDKKCKGYDYTCLKGLHAERRKEICKGYKRSHEKYYHKESSQEYFTKKRLEAEECDGYIHYLQYGELFDQEFRKYEKRRKKLEILFVLECTEKYLMERFGKPRVSLKVKYDFQNLKVTSIEAYADGKKFDCPFDEEDLQNIAKKSYAVGKQAGYVKTIFVEDAAICRECEYSNMWPRFSSYYWADDEKPYEKDGEITCLKGFDADDDKEVCSHYKKSREKYYHGGFPWEKEDTKQRLEEADEDDACLQYYELFDEDHKKYENDKLEILLVLECTEKYLMERFGKPRVSLKVRYDCKEFKIIVIEAYADGNKIDCHLNEDDLNGIRDRCYKVGSDIGKIESPKEFDL